MSRCGFAVRLAVAGAVGVITLLGVASPAGAHASLVSTSPSTDSVVDTVPEEVTMTFTEAVTALPGSVEVYGPDGERVDKGTPGISADSTTVDIGLDPGGQGTYTVSWRVTSDDGHTISGSWVFHVGQQSGAVTLDDDAGDRAADVVAWFARVLFSAGIIGVVGVGAVAGTGLAGWRSITVPRAEARRVWIAAGAAAVTGAALGLIAEVAEATGSNLLAALGDIADVVAGSRSGALDALKLAACVVVLLLVSVVRHRLVVPVALSWALAAITISALSGHAAVTAAPLLSVPIDVAHFAAAGVWLGGLAVLVSTAGRSVPIERWSTVAAVAVGVIAVTGIGSSLFQLGAPRGLWETDYGRLLIAKVAVAALMVALGWLNRRHLAELAARAGSALRRVRGETVAGVAVLAITGVLVSTVPATDALARPFSGSTSVGSVDATFTVDPARVGANSIHIIFTDSSGGPAEVDAAELTVSGPGVEPARVRLTPITTSHYTTADASFGRPGTWRLDLVAVTDGEPATGSVSVPIR
jgi:copper transport protein